MPAMNPFTTAKVVSSKTKSTKSAPTDAHEIKGIAEFYALRTVYQALEGVIKATEFGVKERASEHFIDEGFRKHIKPDNFKGYENETVDVDGEKVIRKAVVGCEMRKRSSMSILSEDQKALLDKHGVSTQVKTPSTFSINPEYVEDAALMKKVAEALSKVPGLPTDFFTTNEPVYVTTDTTIAEVFALKDKQAVKELIPVVCTFGLKPSGTSTMSWDDCWAKVKTMIEPKSEE